MRKGRAISMIVLFSTHKLAWKVQEDINEVDRTLGLFTTVFHGGVSYDPQSNYLRNGLDVMIGLPVWVINNMNNNNLDLYEADTKHRHGQGPTNQRGENMNAKEELK